MDRRHFVAASMAAGGAWLMADAVADARQAAPAKRAQEYYELRRYRLRRGPGQAVGDAYLKTAPLPPWRRGRGGAIRVFTVLIGPRNPASYRLLLHTNPQPPAS